MTPNPRSSSYSLPGALLVPVSDNSKTGRITTTYVAQSTCPPVCPLRSAGCYAEIGAVGFHTYRLNKQGTSATEAAQSEALLLRQYAKGILAGQHPNPPMFLRLHVVGDVPNWGRVRELAQAVAAWHRAVCKHYAKHGRTVTPKALAYTHNWRSVPRHHWGLISALASCETLRQASEARALGYTPALIVSKFKSPNAYMLPEGISYISDDAEAHWVIPCPAQTSSGKIQCVDCKLCFNDTMRSGGLIGFEAHGARAKKLQELVRLEAK